MKTTPKYIYFFKHKLTEDNFQLVRYFSLLSTLHPSPHTHPPTRKILINHEKSTILKYSCFASSKINKMKIEKGILQRPEVTC